MKYSAFLLIILLQLYCIPLCANAVGSLSDNIPIESKYLGYTLHYRTYVPNQVQANSRLPALYVTDGQWYLTYGAFIETLEKEIQSGRIQPVIVIFIDSRNPDDLSEFRRQKEFICEKPYAQFFKGELIPAIEHSYPVQQNQTGRTILGVSFGAINSACFGLMLHDTFTGIAMHSPGNHHHINFIRKQFKANPVLPLKFFLSVGTKQDNWQATRKLRHILKRKGYDITYKEVPKNHDWKNWAPLIDDTLQTFYTKTAVNK